MLYKTNNDKNIVINTSIIDDDFYFLSIFTGSRRIHAKFIMGDFQVILSLSRTISYDHYIQ
jgi:hypothetical protein